MRTKQHLKKIAILAPEKTVDLLLSAKNRKRLHRLCDVTCFGLDHGGREEDGVPGGLEQAEIVLSGWGMPKLTPAILERAQNLKIVIYGGSSVKYFLTEGVFQRGIVVTSAAPANGRAVAEFTVAMMTLSLKGAWPMVRRETDLIPYFSREAEWPERGGMYGAVIGIIGAGSTGREVLRLLKAYDCTPLLYDPYVGRAEARSLGAVPATLDKLLQKADVVSLHAPNIAELRHMIGRRELALMKDGCWFINTARGALVDEEALRRELRSGRIRACIDVTDPEPPAPDDPLLSLPNAIVTPHIAGAVKADCRRMGNLCMLELLRYLRRQEPLYPVRQDLLSIIN